MVVWEVADVNYRDLGKRIKQQRIMNRLTQEELAEKSGISCSFVGHIERGEKKFSIGTLVALCNALRVSPNYLLQDSMDLEILNNSVDVGKQNKALFDDLMNVLHEHRIRDDNYS